MKSGAIVKEMAMAKDEDPPMVIYTYPSKPIVVEAQDFQTLVQSLTGGKRKRKEGAVPEEGEVAEQSSTQLQQEQQQPGAKGQQVQTLLEYLDRLDQECAPPARAAANLGFFPTAGLVKGVKIDEGLQQLEIAESPRCPLVTQLLCGGPGQETTEKARSIAKVLTPLLCLPRCKLECSEEAPEWTGCLSPRSLQVNKHAQRLALWAASGDRSGSGPWKLSLEEIADEDRCSSEPDEWGLPVDRLYYKGEVTLVEQAE